MKDDIHDSCALAHKSITELATRCAQSLEKKNMAEAYHCALHHLRTAHAGVDEGKVAFFTANLPAVNDAMLSVAKSTGEVSEDKMAQMLEPLKEGSTPDYDLRMAILGFKKFVLTNSGSMASVGFLSGMAMAMYINSSGEGCIFSLIDPELCKEHS